jgi:hypothetical protein
MCTVWKEEELRLAKIRELKAWWRARGTHGFIYSPGKDSRAKGLVERSWPQVVALDRGASPKKIGRWKGFLDQSAKRSIGVLG